MIEWKLAWIKTGYAFFFFHKFLISCFRSEETLIIRCFEAMNRWCYAVWAKNCFHLLRNFGFCFHYDYLWMNKLKFRSLCLFFFFFERCNCFLVMYWWTMKKNNHFRMLGILKAKSSLILKSLFSWISIKKGIIFLNLLKNNAFAGEITFQIDGFSYVSWWNCSIFAHDDHRMKYQTSGLTKGSPTVFSGACLLPHTHVNIDRYFSWSISNHCTL